MITTKNIFLKPSKMRRKWSEIKKSILFYGYCEEKSNMFNRSFVTMTSKIYLKPYKNVEIIKWDKKQGRTL